MPTDHNQFTYQPIDTLKPVADDVWIVDGPIITFGIRWLRLPFPTRMTVLRLPRGNLFIHSPTALNPALAAAVTQLGRPRWIVGPSRIHYWWLPDWHAAFPDARVSIAPRTRRQAGRRIDFNCAVLDRTSGYPWDEHVATLPIAGSYMTEVEFFHYASRTLVLTDLVENFERNRLDSRTMRLLTWIGGVQEPGGMPRDMRLTFLRRRTQLRAAVQTMIDWDPVRIIIAHGRWYERDGRAELLRAFHWLL